MTNSTAEILFILKTNNPIKAELLLRDRQNLVKVCKEFGMEDIEG